MTAPDMSGSIKKRGGGTANKPVTKGKNAVVSRADIVKASKQKKAVSPITQGARIILLGAGAGFLAFAGWSYHSRPITSSFAPYDPTTDPKSAHATYYEYMRDPSWPGWARVRFASKDEPPLAVSPKVGRTFGVILPETSAAELKSGIRADVFKRDAVREAFEHSWSGYEQNAWGADEYHSISKGGSNLTDVGGIGYTIVDSLDSLLLMGFDQEYERARDWVRDGLSFEKDGNFNTFETTIRVLGGLLSAHHLTSIHPVYGETTDPELFLNKAIDLADRILPAFDTPSGLPLSMINLEQRKGVPDRDNNFMVSLAEAASLQLELKYLSHLTGDMIYWRKAEKVTSVIRQQSMNEGICPIFLDPRTGKFMSSEIRLGSRGDSYYEYLIKQYLQTNRKEPVYREMYDSAMKGIKNLMMNRTPREGLLYTQELSPQTKPGGGAPGWRIVPKQDHLVCFLGGSFLLGLTEGGRKSIDWNDLSPTQLSDFLAGTGIIDTCVDTYNTATGLGPEIAMFWLEEELKGQSGDWYMKSERTNPIDSRNILRPETVESLFLAYRLTGDEKYRRQGWKIFLAFDEHCRVSGGFASVRNVEKVPAVLEDKMETFWLSETLSMSAVVHSARLRSKADQVYRRGAEYLYLLFDDGDSISLDSHVFNTEAHILPVFEPHQLTAFSRS